MRTFEFLYYCLYRMFNLVPRQGAKDENLASSFFSILLTTNTVMVLFILRYILPTRYLISSSFSNVLKIMLFSLFIIWYFLCKYYFLREKKFEKIIEKLEKKYIGKNKLIAILGMMYTICTFIGFIVLAMWLSRLS